MKIARKQRQKARKEIKAKFAAAHKETYDESRCSRCGTKSFERTGFPLLSVCKPCVELNPRLTTAEKNRANIWDKVELLERIAEIGKLEPSGKGYWSWARNWDCKYLDIRVDMRDGGCIVKDSKGVRIGMDALNWQRSEETPERPET